MALKQSVEAPVRILLVDDQAENLLALEAILEAPGLEIAKASSGAEALRQILHKEFALIVMDIQMPDMDGFETATLIRGREKSSKVPIIFVSALHRSEAHIAQGYALGGADYLFKPLVPEMVRGKVRVFVDLHRYRQQLLDSQRREHEQMLRQLGQERERKREETRYSAMLAELDYARNVQASILPTHLQAPGMEVFASVRPARIVGGDFYDLLPDDHTTTCLIGDVMGKGMPAALSMVLAVTVLRENARFGLSPQRLLSESNHEIHERLAGASMSNAVSVAVLSVDQEHHQFRYAKAGHEDLLYYDSACGEIRALSTAGLFLGLQENARYEEATLQYHPGDKVILYTDGITDARSKSREFFGHDRLLSLIRERGHGTAMDMGQAILGAVEEFQANTDPSDDIGLMVVGLTD